MITLDEFKNLHHAVTLLGMSGAGKTMLSTALRRSGGWYHFSADYRIGTRYLVEHILDNIKFKIMQMEDPFVANLLRSDSIYISHNITVDNLDTVSTYLGMYGDPAKGGLDKQTFLERQDDYRRAEVRSMLDVPRFIDKAWQIYGCKDFVNDASGSLCEIVELDDATDAVIAALSANTLILYIQADPDYEEKLKERARTHPKPLFYNPQFIAPHLEGKPEDGRGVDPLEFARPLFPDLLEFRKPRYARIAERHGFTVHSRDLFQAGTDGSTVPDRDTFIERLYANVTDQAQASAVAAANLETYLFACRERAKKREA
jgi:hypothetical protein